MVYFKKPKKTLTDTVTVTDTDTYNDTVYFKGFNKLNSILKGVKNVEF